MNPNNLSSQPRSVLKWSLIASIVIVINLFFGYALSVIYKAPQFDLFCKNEQVVQPLTTKDACLNVGGQWTESTNQAFVTDNQPQKVNAYCNPTFTCQKNYETAQQTYDRNVFVTLVAVGVIILVISFFVGANVVIANGLALGGVLSFIIASLRYWSSADDIVKVFILGAALASLIYIAYKKFNVQ